MRRFVGIDLGREPVPDETTVCRFRRLLEQHDLGRRLLEEVQRHLAQNVLKIVTGTIFLSDHGRPYSWPHSICEAFGRVRGLSL